MTGPSLTFLGAAGTVTGSRFLIDGSGSRVLVDAGLYQGVRELRRRNWSDFPVAPGSVDAVLLTHAHLDHCGYLPRLVRGGFAGPIHCTPYTAALAEVVLRDSAHLQEEDAAFANKAGYSRHSPALPLYDTADVTETIRLFRPVVYDQEVAAAPGVVARFLPAGHILGSATVHVAVDGGSAHFSGDLGRPFHPLLQPPAAPLASGALVVESTYGDRVHEEPDDAVLAGAITRTVGRGGSVLIPAFAVDRTELVLLRLRALRESGRIPEVPIYVDSPMALTTLDIYRKATREPGSGMRTGLASAQFEPGDLHLVHDALGSARINNPACPSVIVSASGMASGGRVVHHLREQLPDRRNTVVLTGYQAIGTRGRQLLDGARVLKMHGRYVPVRAEIVQDSTFSVHADAGELIAWIASAPEPPRTVYVVHGEADASAHLARRIEQELGLCAVVPRLGERVLL
ncbi:MBL fold metallo-hydrolase RNA specificity domain-containing protein [Marmoricola sp. RAF53]|uniref:MBL fold metallo-hydrolase RNA specificity domain-containing protein n=1 Tax=Marmoricola sp. RAF53 TaxID=3233059 RepID=UPI003F9D45AD